MGKKILVVAAHADDEALGCGGTIAKHTKAGDEVHLVIIADGVSSRVDSNDYLLLRRKDARQKAQEVLGISKTWELDLPDNMLDSIPLLKIVQKLESILKFFPPEVIYTHYYDDLNVDHRITAQAVLTACRPQPNFSVTEILGFEVLSSTEWTINNQKPFAPSFFVDISTTVDIKLNALKAYSEEMRPAPHSRSIDHAVSLAQHRGMSIGRAFAEGFYVYRLVR
jgi:LmbE family N-acetylglucosaminyl deacetylase